MLASKLYQIIGGKASKGVKNILGRISHCKKVKSLQKKCFYLLIIL